MDSEEIMPLINEYRKETNIDARLVLIERLYHRMKPTLAKFVVKIAHPLWIEEVLEDTLYAVLKYLDEFRGRTDKSFWAFCTLIARRRSSDVWRKYFRGKTEPLPPEEINMLLRWAEQRSKPLSPEDKMDLDYALNLLEKTKPECRKLLWNHYVVGWKAIEMARELKIDAAALRMRINRCLDFAQGLV